MSWSSLPHSERERIRKIVLSRDRGVCQLRIEGVCTHRATQVDHIAPREIAGDGPENGRAACAPCNLKRGDPRRRDPDVTRPTWMDTEP